MKKLLISLFLVFFGTAVYADGFINDLRKLFAGNGAVIYAVNMRTFGAVDADKNGIIDLGEAEESGNFLNAISRLDELKAQGVNTLHLLPVTPVGKTKALGTAGSLYAASAFNTLNPQLASDKTVLSVETQAKKFFDEAHARGFRIIVDLPSCGAYDLYLKRPELFVKDKSGQPVVPSDWTDVRLLNAGTEAVYNKDVYNLYKAFVDYMINLGADGIRADAASTKPASFWKDLIAYSHRRDPQFLWLAEASELWTKPVAQQAVFTPAGKLFDAGFDGYYGSFFTLKDWKTGKELTAAVARSKGRGVIGSFATHDEPSPIITGGERFSEMIIWLNATLPVNSYFVDGFSTGDTYVYSYANQKARKTFTDDQYYFVHRGKLDIFNFSRKPGGYNLQLQRQFEFANRFKSDIASVLASGQYTTLSAAAPSVFAYMLSHETMSVVVYGNLDRKNPVETGIRVPKINQDSTVMPIKIIAVPIAGSGKLNVKLEPGEIQVLVVGGADAK